MLAQTTNITRVHLLLTSGNKRQRTFVAEAIKDLNLTAEDLATKSEQARNVPDLELLAIIFAVT